MPGKKKEVASKKEVAGEGGSQRKAKAGLPGRPGPLALELVEREFR